MAVTIDTSKLTAGNRGLVCSEVQKYLQNYQPGFMALTQEGNYLIDVVPTGGTKEGLTCEIRNYCSGETGKTIMVRRIATVIITTWGLCFLPPQEKVFQLIRC